MSCRNLLRFLRLQRNCQFTDSKFLQHIRYAQSYPDIEAEIADEVVNQNLAEEKLSTLSDQQKTLPFLKQLRVGESLKDDVQIGHNKIHFEVGAFARVSNGACVTTAGNTKVLATAVMEEESGFFVPTEMQLYVDFRTPAYATGRIPFTPSKREGAPTDTELMALNAIDKSIRPLFPPGFFHKLQIQAQVLSADGEQDPTVHAINAVSQALMCSDIPWGGPIGAVRICRIRDQFKINPTLEDQELCSMNLLYVITLDDKVVMMESTGKQVSEGVFLEAIQYAHQEAQKLLQPQIDMAKRSGLKKRKINQLGSDFTAYRIISQFADPIIDQILDDQSLSVGDQQEALIRARAVVTEKMFRRGALRREQIRTPGSGCATNRDLVIAFNMCLSDAIRRRLFKNNLRIDNRAPGDLKVPYSQIDAVPIVHGSALFQLGETQTLTTCTIGGRSDILREQTIIGFSTNRLIVNVGQSGFASREVTYRGPPTKEEIQAGQMVQNALEPLMPSPMVFPFPSRINADILSKGGGTLSTAICGGALALRNAGVPIQNNIAAINLGIVHEKYQLSLLRELPEVNAEMGYDKLEVDEGRCEFLIDMSALEQQICDANLTVAATHRGICAVDFAAQRDGIPFQKVQQAFEKAYNARTGLLAFIDNVVIQSEKKSEDSGTSRFGTIQIDQDNVTRLIGIGGTNIRKIIEKTDCRILVDTSGEVKIYAPTKDRYDEAVALVKEVDGSISVGQVLNGKVTNVTSFGIFMQLPNLPSAIGAMIHVTELAHDKRSQTTEGIKIGDSMEVKIIGKDAKGNFQLSRKALIPLSETPNIPDAYSAKKDSDSDSSSSDQFLDDSQQFNEQMKQRDFGESSQSEMDQLSSKMVFGGDEGRQGSIWDDPWAKPDRISYIDDDEVQEEQRKGNQKISRKKQDWGDF